MAMSTSSQLLVEAPRLALHQNKNLVKACPSSSLLSGFSSRVGYFLSPRYAFFSSNSLVKTHARPSNSSTNIEKKMGSTAEKPFFNKGIDYYARNGNGEKEEDDGEYEGGGYGVPTRHTAEQGGEMGGIQEWISDLYREERESQSAADNLQWLEERVMEGDRGRSAEDYSRRAGVFSESAEFFIERKKKYDRVALDVQRLQDVVMKEDRGKSPQDYNARADIFSKSAEILISTNNT